MTEKQPYQLVSQSDDIEIRRYPEHMVAETRVSASFENAGNQAFRYLFGYISGQNTTAESIAMTSPVVQEASLPTSKKIAMTSPVIQEAEGDEFVVAFVLPASFTAETTPKPTSPRVVVRTVPTRMAAAIRFTGRWSAGSYEKHLNTLLEQVAAVGKTTKGEPRFARFDPPYTPWFLRHNEISIDVDTDDDVDEPGGEPSS